MLEWSVTSGCLFQWFGTKRVKYTANSDTQLPALCKHFNTCMTGKYSYLLSILFVCPFNKIFSFYGVCSWASRHREQLQAMNSSLEFKLHRLRFIELVCQGGVKQQEALAFARNFSLFAQGHTKGKFSTRLKFKKICYFQINQKFDFILFPTFCLTIEVWDTSESCSNLKFCCL